MSWDLIQLTDFHIIRDKQQAVRGCIPYKTLQDVKKDILVFGNGDIFDPESALDMFEKTGCDGILVSRGTLGAPWISELIESSIGDHDFPHRIDGPFMRDLLKKHLKYSKAFNEDRKAMIDMRKVSTWTFKGEPEMAQFRDKLNRAKSLVEIETLIDSYDFEALSCRFNKKEH